MSDVIECAFDISIYYPWSCGVGPCQAKNFFARVVTSSARAKPVADPLKAGFPKRFQSVFHHGLDTSIDDGGQYQAVVGLSAWGYRPYGLDEPCAGQVRLAGGTT